MTDRMSEQDLDLIFRSARTANRYLDREVTIEQLQEIWDLTKWGRHRPIACRHASSGA